MAVKETVDKGTKWKKVVLIVVGIVIVIAIIIGIFVGFASVKKFFLYLFVALLVISVIFLLIYLFWMLFIKVEFKDIPAQTRKKLEIASKLAENEMLGKLFLSGDTKHNRLNYGKYFYLRINLPKINKEDIVDSKGKQKMDDLGNPMFKETTEILPIDMFIVQRKGFFSRLFNDPLFILCHPEDHDFSSIFNDVVIRGFNIVPLDNYFYTIDSRSLDTTMLRALSVIYQKEAVFEQFRDLDKLVKGAINLDSRFYKEKEKSSEFELPQLDKYKGDK
jgi:hypothetical protein